MYRSRRYRQDFILLMRKPGISHLNSEKTINKIIRVVPGLLGFSKHGISRAHFYLMIPLNQKSAPLLVLVSLVKPCSVFGYLG